MPDKPISDNDPVVSKSLAPHYVVAILVLMATLFWALWDEDQLSWHDRISQTCITSDHAALPAEACSQVGVNN